MKFYTIVIITLFLNLLSLSANATIIEYKFSGVFSRTVSITSDPDVSVGNPFTGLFSYDEDAPLSRIVEPDTRASYSTGKISVKSGSYSYSAISGPQLQIFNNWEHPAGTSVFDDFFLSVDQNDASGQGFFLLQLDMRDYTLSVLDSLSIPTTTQVEYLSERGRFFLRRFSSNNVEEWWANGYFQGITPAAVPEPTTLLLLGTGLVGVAGAARRRKKNQT